jgi:AdoMet-dependent heme synthase
MPIRPRELRINVGDICNRRCPGCSKTGAKDTAGTAAPLQAFFDAIDQIRAQGTLQSVSLTGGEPLHPDLRSRTFQLIQYAAPARVRLCTNGDFLDAPVAAELRRLGLASVQIGLDSSTPDFHNRRSASPTAWQSTLAGIANALQADLPVSIRYTLYAQNLDDVANTYRLVSAMHVAQFKLRTLFPSGGAAASDLLRQLPTGTQLAHAQFAALRVSHNNPTRLELSQPAFFTIPEGCNAFLEDNTSCGQWNNASINSRGTVEYCLFCDDGSRFGNIQQHPFLDLWNAPQIAAARRQRQRQGAIVGCPAYEIQRQRHLGDYATFESQLQTTTAQLQPHL